MTLNPKIKGLYPTTVTERDLTAKNSVFKARNGGIDGRKLTNNPKFNGSNPPVTSTGENSGKMFKVLLLFIYNLINL